MGQQSAQTVLLVRPAAFGFNAEAAASNAFAKAAADADVQSAALREFDALANALDSAGVETLILDDVADTARPDAVFPNNWVSFHGDGAMVVYPMATAPRRLERRVEDVRKLLLRRGFAIDRLVDLTGFEAEGRYLEGTGSLILDRGRQQAYASRSARTDGVVVEEFDRQLGYSTLLFDAADPQGRPIYHTNVLLSLGTQFAVLCLEAVSAGERHPVVAQIEASGRTIIEASFDQLRDFACNLLELRSRSGDPCIALSERALRSFRPDQLRKLEAFGALVTANIPTIERVGGGSVRCMIAEVHLPRSR